ncbi:peptidylprolyl isomerase [Polaribacter sp.]|nr:peptidylprolyl isomerase [Polaribacter sp.]
MAILSKIRERSMFLIIIIGLALFAFVLDPSTLSDFFSSSKTNEVGSVDGEAISRQEYLNELEAYQQQTGGRVSEMQAAKTVWNNLLRKKVYQKQLEEAGIKLGEKDLWNEVTNAPSVKDNPQFQNEFGMFDEGKFKQFLADTKENNPDMWSAWNTYMNQLGESAATNTYNNLVAAGLGASLKEGQSQYFIDNTKLSAQFLFVPYTSVADSLVGIKKSEVESYIKNHEADYTVEASRDIKYVKFAIEPSQEDEEAIKNNVASLIQDEDDNGVIIPGLKSTEEYKAFLSENDSDVNLDENFKYNLDINQEFADELFKLDEGEVFGPYKDKGFFKISKVVEVSKMPDSVKASHILIPFIGSQSANETTVKTKEQAKQLADSILNVVERRSSKFADLAKEFSSDTGSAQKGGELDWFSYNRMVPAFRDYAFNNNKGDIGVVESGFGFHVIIIEDQKNTQKVMKLATFGREITPSEATENKAFRDAEQFALELSNNTNFDEISKASNYSTKPAVGLKMLDENVPGLGNQRQIISWAFSKSVNVGDFKRFDLEGSYVVAQLTDKTEKGLMPVDKAISQVRPILIKEKKAALLADKFNAGTLQEIATENNTTVKNAASITLKTPTLSGAGSEPKVVGAMYYAEKDKLYKNIVGNRGVYAFKVTGKSEPTELPNYENERKKIAQSRKRLTYRIFDAVKDASEIEDYRESVYVSE